MIGVEFHK